MAGSAARLPSGQPPITATLGRILYHPEAIMLAAEPPDALTPIREAALAATLGISCTDGQSSVSAAWTPHITTCYGQSASMPDR